MYIIFKIFKKSYPKTLIQNLLIFLKKYQIEINKFWQI